MSRRTVLIVDDFADNREVHSIAFEFAGWLVAEAADGD